MTVLRDFHIRTIKQMTFHCGLSSTRPDLTNHPNQCEFIVCEADVIGKFIQTKTMVVFTRHGLVKPSLGILWCFPEGFVILELNIVQAMYS